MAEILKKRQPIFKINRFNTSHSKPYKKILHYLIGQVLGKGGFASVHEALEIQTKEKVAVKIINIQGYSQRQLNKTMEQVEIMRIIDHANIARIYQTYQDELYLMIFMELIKGQQLFDYICQHGPLKEKIAAHIFHQIVSTVKYLHQKGIVHRDIKAQNVMIDENFNAKLIDFGLAKIETKKHDNLFGDFCGSPSYLAPQILSKKKYNGAKIDIWCLGVLLYVMLQGSLPFQSKNETKQGRNQNIKMMNWHYPIFSSSSAKKLYATIFTPSQQRISIDQILESSFFKKHGLKINQTSLHVIKSKSRTKNVEKAISLTTQVLNIPEQNVKLQIKEKQLGEVYSIYNLLLKKENLQNYIMEKNSIITEVNNSKVSISSEGQQFIQNLKVLKTKLQTIKIQKQSPVQNYRKGSQKNINQQRKRIINLRNSNQKQILQKYLKQEQKSNEKNHHKLLNIRQTLISKKKANKNILNISQLYQQSKINRNNKIKIIKIDDETFQKIDSQQIKRISRN